MRRPRGIILATLLAAGSLVIVSPPAIAASGDLDPSFSRNGISVIDAFGSPGVDIALQHGGQIVSAGYSSESYRAMGVTRLRANGSPDRTFAGDGEATVEFPDANGFSCYTEARAVATARNGDIVIAGRACRQIAVARLQHDGDLDTTFGTDGTALIPVHGGVKDVTGLALDASGNIDVLGDNAAGDVVVARLHPRGRLDRRFAGDGIRVVSIEGRARANALALRDDGGLVVAGDTYTAPSYPLLRPFVLQLDPNTGRPVPSFGTGGVTILDTQGSFADVVLDGDAPVAGGVKGWNLLVARLTADGQPDDAFGPGGIRTQSFTSGCCDIGFGVTITGSGDVLAAGCAGCYRRDTGLGLVAYGANGELERVSAIRDAS
jgi:uncharacterized delta-60 repeat protein